MLAIGTGLVVFLVLDMIWLGVIMKGFYRDALGDLARTSNGSLDPLYAPAILVYILIVVGLYVFVLPRASGNLMTALAYGAMFGLVVYGVYDLTNHATLRDWATRMTVVDMLWGATVCGLTSAAMARMA